MGPVLKGRADGRNMEILLGRNSALLCVHVVEMTSRVIVCSGCSNFYVIGGGMQLLGCAGGLCASVAGLREPTEAFGSALSTSSLLSVHHPLQLFPLLHDTMSRMILQLPFDKVAIDRERVSAIGAVLVALRIFFQQLHVAIDSCRECCYVEAS